MRRRCEQFTKINVPNALFLRKYGVPNLTSGKISCSGVEKHLAVTFVTHCKAHRKTHVVVQRLLFKKRVQFVTGITSGMFRGATGWEADGDSVLNFNCVSFRFECCDSRSSSNVVWTKLLWMFCSSPGELAPDSAEAIAHSVAAPVETVSLFCL